MTLSEFNFFTPDQRVILVWRQGDLLATRDSGRYTFILYHMGEFFAEARCLLGQGRVEAVRGFTCRKQLDPYLEQIGLSELKL